MGRSGRRRGRRKGAGTGLGDRLGALLLGLVLVGVGFLLGSFWLEWRGMRPPAGGAAADPGSGSASVAGGRTLEARPRIEVLNGVGERGVARRAAEALRAAGFDVVYFGNAGRFGHEVTRVLDRSGRNGAADEVARRLGLQGTLVEPDPGLHLDATVILGADWREAIGRLTPP